MNDGDSKVGQARLTEEEAEMMARLHAQFQGSELRLSEVAKALHISLEEAEALLGAVRHKKLAEERIETVKRKNRVWLTAGAALCLMFLTAAAILQGIANRRAAIETSAPDADVIYSQPTRAYEPGAAMKASSSGVAGDAMAAKTSDVAPTASAGPIAAGR